jgi:hypothetical protein
MVAICPLKSVPVFPHIEIIFIKTLWLERLLLFIENYKHFS